MTSSKKGKSLTKEMFGNRVKERLCPLAKTMNEMDSESVAVVEEVLADPAYTHTVIVTVLREAGWATNTDRVRRHRNGGCSCAK